MKYLVGKNASFMFMNDSAIKETAFDLECI